MKKLSIIILVVFSFCLLLFGCGNTEIETIKESISVYSFSGSNDQFEISNGVIVLTDDEDVFSGGDLRVVQTELFSDVVSYKATFYIRANGEDIVVMSNSVIDETGEKGVQLDMNGDLGRISGEDAHIDYALKDVTSNTDRLWCEINTSSSDGVENTYVIKLDVTKITY